MGYYIRFLKNKKSVPNWKVQYISLRKKDRKITSTAKAKKTTWDVAKHRWSVLGFHTTMHLDEAQVRAKQLNSQLLLKKQEEKIKVMQDQQNQFQLRYNSILPEEFVSEFEERFVRARDIVEESKKKVRNKNRFTVWRAAQKIIIKVNLEPTLWFYHQTKFYDAFCESQMSHGYLLSVLTTINLWGNFITRKLCQPFNPVLRPRGYEKQRILEFYYKKSTKHREASKPITPEHLSDLLGKINSYNFNWLYISVWLGLRPQVQIFVD